MDSVMTPSSLGALPGWGRLWTHPAGSPAPPQLSVPPPVVAMATVLAAQAQLPRKQRAGGGEQASPGGGKPSWAPK